MRAPRKSTGRKKLTACCPKSGRRSSRTLEPTALGALPLALRRRVVRAAAESLGLRLEFRHVEEVLDLAGGGPVRHVAAGVGYFPGHRRIAVRIPPAPRPRIRTIEYSLSVPGAVEVPEAGTRFEAALVSGSASSGYNPDHMLDPALLQKELTVRNWRAGDRYWPAHSKAPKKIKELLQERKLTGPERKLWPVGVSGQEIVWVRGFPTPARLRPPDGTQRALVIRELASRGGPKHE